MSQLLSLGTFLTVRLINEPNLLFLREAQPSARLIPNSGREQAEIPLLELHEDLHDLFDVGDPRRGLDRRKSLQDFRGTKLPEDNLRKYATFQDTYNKYILIIIE